MNLEPPVGSSTYPYYSDTMENAKPRSRKFFPYLVLSLLVCVGVFFIFFFSTRSSNTPAATASSLPTITSPERTPLAEITNSAEISESGQKVIYLTFDDGPGPYTAKLLDILKKYDVKVTFFVTGAGDDALIAREYNEGHTVGLHTYTHDYAYVYSSLDNFFTDLYEIQARVKNITGQTSMLTRFPGGSSNLISARYDGGIGIMSRLSEELPARGFTYFDWNISSGDAGGATTSSEVYQNVINALSPNYSVVLQHDIKDFSVDAVEDIIKYGKANGYTFKKLDAGSFTAHHGINN